MKWYEANKNLVQLGPCFVYEVITYLIYKDRVELYETKFVKSSKFLDPKNKVTKKGKGKDYCIMKSEELIIAPEDYLLRNGFKEFNYDGSKKGKRKQKEGKD